MFPHLNFHVKRVVAIHELPLKWYFPSHKFAPTKKGLNNQSRRNKMIVEMLRQ